MQAHGDLKLNMCRVLEGGLWHWVRPWVIEEGRGPVRIGERVSGSPVTTRPVVSNPVCVHVPLNNSGRENGRTHRRTHTHTQTRTAFGGSGAPDVLGFLFDASTAGRACGCGLSVSGSCERQKLG